MTRPLPPDVPRKRPGPQPREETRSVQLAVRLSPTEAETVRAAAAALGLTPSEYLRLLVLGSPAR